jgi:hypothetical protein
MLFRKPLLGFGVLAALALASGAKAQQQPPNLTALHDALHLTAAQESAWSAYKASVIPPAGAQARRQAAAELFPTLPAPRRIDLVEAEMQQDMDELHRQAQALKTFYATLDTQQQRIFDTQTLPSQGSGRDDD